MKEEEATLTSSLISTDRENQPSKVYSKDFKPKLMDLQGQCKIKEVMFLKFNFTKAISFTILLSISVIGLLFLKYFFKLRVKLFYSIVNDEQSSKCSHVYVKSQQNAEQISEVTKIASKYIFQFKKLKYQIVDNSWLPLGFNVQKIQILNTQQPYTIKGLSTAQTKKRQKLYGRNQHKVEVPTYFEFMFDTMTKPFFVFQYLVSLIYFLQNVPLFAALMIIFGLITTSINYILLHKSYNLIKKTAEKHFTVKVLRNGRFQQINNIDLVPGDLYQPHDEIPCDSILIKGNLFLNEVNLTGQNVPICKSKVLNSSNRHDKSHWLYEGSTVQTTKENTLALAVYVGYSSQRGRIIRKILTKVSKEPQFFKKLLYFQLQVMIITFIIYLLSLPQLLSLDIDTSMIIFRFCNFITYSFPAPFPIFFNLAYSFCLMRLNNAGIMGIQAEKTVESSRMKIICFDKTGTLTLNNVKIADIYCFKDQVPIKYTKIQKDSDLVTNIFSCCNSIQKINGELQGDQIDIRMFEYAQGVICDSKNQNIVRQLHINGKVLEILKINQYQSQFQSMSVLVRDVNQNKYYSFAKGSPEIIYKHSLNKINGYDHFIKKLSLSGFRSIAFGFKQIKEIQIDCYMRGDRQMFLSNIEVLGVVTFINLLKSDARETIKTLSQCDINTKIITGDNIFLGIQTAIDIGMISKNAKIIVLEGRHFCKKNNSIQVLQIIQSQTTISENHRFISNFQYENEQNVVYAIDNDFIKQNPNNFIHEKVKVFARISPENKALIVKKYKQLFQVYKKQGWRRIFEDCRYKVGMIGDGANDLIAIKQADVGVGISQSDAVYSASFSVKQLTKIIQIIKQSKNTERQIIEMTKYYGLTQFTSIVITLICSTDASYLTGIELIYKNFLNTLLITLLLAMTKPAKRLTKALNNSNILDLQNHLVYWVTMFIYSLGLIISYGYYSQTDDFVPNSHTQAKFPEGWYGLTKSSTINFFTSNIMYITLPFVIYRSSPWKLPIWTNKPLSLAIIVNIILLVPLCYLTAHLSAFTIQPIGRLQISVVIGIMMITFACALAANKLIETKFMKIQIEKDTKQILNGQDLLKSQI